MNRYIPEIKDFELKAKKFTNKLIELKQQKPLSINLVANLAGIKNEDLDSLIFYLKRGEIIETDKETKSVRTTLYGELMLEGKINIGFAPML